MSTVDIQPDLMDTDLGIGWDSTDSYPCLGFAALCTDTAQNLRDSMVVAVVEQGIVDQDRGTSADCCCKASFHSAFDLVG